MELQQKRAVIYCRVSTKEQVEEGNSLVTQERICREYAEKNNYSIASIFIEQGESAKTTDRTELQKMFVYCSDKKNAIKAIIIYKLDRLSRNTDDYSQIRLLLKRYNVEIKSTSEYFENTPVGRFMENTMANIAQFDNDIRTERSVGGMKEAVREGRYVWKAPIGYDNASIAGKATIAPNEMAPIIRQAFELVASNKYQMEEIRMHINAIGLRNKKGNLIAKSYFYRMFKNELYTGRVTKFGETKQGNFTTIVSEELFQRVQRVLQGKYRIRREYKVAHTDFPLRRFVFNEEGQKLTGCWSQGRRNKYPYYRFGIKGSNHNRDNFEKLFMEFLNKYRLKSHMITRFKQLIKTNLIDATKEVHKQNETLEKKVNELKDRQSKLILKNLDNVISDDLLQQQLAILDREILSIESQLFNTDLNRTGDIGKALDVAITYLENPSIIWKASPLLIQWKLQWFEFPQGIVFTGAFFRTTEINSIFKLIQAFFYPFSPKVNLRNLSLNTTEIKQSNSTSKNREQNICRLETVKEINWQKIGQDLIYLANVLSKETP